MVQKCCKLPKNHKWKLFFIEWSPPYLGSCYLHVDHILPTTPSPFKGKYNVKPLGKGFKNGISIMDGGWKDFHLMGFKLCTNLYLVTSTKMFFKNGQTKVICESKCECSRGLPWNSLKQLYYLHLTIVLIIIVSTFAGLFHLLGGKQKNYKIPYFLIAMSEQSPYLTFGILGQNHKEFWGLDNRLYLT